MFETVAFRFHPPAFLGDNNRSLLRVGGARTMRSVSCTSYHDNFLSTIIKTESRRNLTSLLLFDSFFFIKKKKKRLLTTAAVSVVGLLFVATRGSSNWFNCAGVMRPIKEEKEPSVGSRVHAGRILMNEGKVM